MEGGQLAAVLSRNAEIRRCEVKIERARRHASKTKSHTVRQLDNSAVRFYRERIQELRQRNVRQAEAVLEKQTEPDREFVRHLGFGLWAQ